LRAQRRASLAAKVDKGRQSLLRSQRCLVGVAEAFQETVSVCPFENLQVDDVNLVRGRRRVRHVCDAATKSTASGGPRLNREPRLSIPVGNRQPRTEAGVIAVA